MERRYFNPQGERITHDEWYQLFFTMSAPERRVGADATPNGVVYTSYLGYDWATPGSDTPPSIYQTTVDGGPLDGEGDEWPSREAALAGHEVWVERVLGEVA